MALATPFISVVPGLLAGFADAPLVGPAKTIGIPLVAGLTVATSALGNGLLTRVLCGVPPVALIVAGVRTPQTSLVSAAPAPTTVLQAVFMPASVAESPVNVGAEPK